MAGPGSLVLLVDVADAAVLGAAQAGLRRFGAALCLQPGDGAAAGALAAPPPAAPRPVLGLANLARPPGAPKPVVQVRCRPSPYQLREFHSAVGRLQPAAGITASEAAKALLQVVGVVSQDAACAAAGPRRALLYLTDRTDYEPADFSPTLELCRGKGVHIELLFMSAAEAAEGGGGGDAAADALAAAWGAAEASFAHLSVTVVPGASRLSFEGLATSLLQRWAPPPALPVSLAFKAPLLGSIRALALAAAPEVRPLAQSVRHAALCPCHRSPAAWAGAAALCAVTGAALDPRQCGRDERTVQVGAQPGGALHLAAPFNIGSAGGGGGGATLNVLGRVKADQANPALLFGVPLLLGPGAGAGERLKVVHDGELADTSQAQLLGVVVGSLSASGEALLACSTTDLESGAAGLFRLHYLLLPCSPAPGAPPALLAKRVACAEELLAPPLLGGASAAAGSETGSAPAPAVAEAVAAAVGRLPLEAQLDPLALSSRCVETVEMLVRESQPMPKPQMPAAPHAPAPAAAPTPAPLAQPAAAAEKAHAQPAAGRGRRPAAAAAGSGAGARSGQQAAGGRGGKGALALSRSARR